MNSPSRSIFTFLTLQKSKFLFATLFSLLFLSACTSQTSLKKVSVQDVVVKKGPNLDEAAEQRLNLGLQYLQNGQVERAKYHLDKALLHGPHKASVQIGLAYYYEQVKQHSRARGHYTKALRIESNNGDYQNLYGSFLCNQGDYKEAEKYFSKAVSLSTYSNVAATYENSGICALKAGNLSLAESSFKMALDHNRNSSISLLEMASIWFEKKNYMKARAFLGRHLAFTQVSAKSLWLGIQVETILGDENALSTYALKLKGMFPSSDEAAIYLDSLN